jgi:dsRNA-specific ribonuclease
MASKAVICRVGGYSGAVLQRTFLPTTTMPSRSRRHRLLSTSTATTIPPQFVIPVPSNFPKIPYNPERLYRFKSQTLEKTVFTHCSLGTLNRQWGSVLNPSASSTTPARHGEIGRADNEHLEWLGDHILKGLTAHLVTQQHPMLDEGRMSVLTTALVCNRFYAHLSRTLGLDQRLLLAETSGQQPLQSDRVLGGLFEAFVGGMHKELGFEGHRKLYEWFEDLITPYARAFWQEMTEAENTARKAFHQQSSIKPFPSPVSKLH